MTRYDDWKCTNPLLEVPLCPVCDTEMDGDECSADDCNYMVDRWSDHMIDGQVW